MAIPNKSLPYLNDNNAVNLTTVKPDVDNKAYIVDKRLLDFLLEKVTLGNLDNIKNAVRIEVNLAKDKSDLFKRLDDYIYLSKIVELVNPTILSVGEAIDAVANSVSAEDYIKHKRKVDSNH